MRTGSKLLRLSAVGACAALAVSVSGVGATVVGATARQPAVAAHTTEYRLTSADIPASGACEVLYFGSGLCMGFSTDIMSDIIAAGGIAVQVVIYILSKIGSGKDKGDPEVKIDVVSGGSYTGDCASVYGTSPIWQSCSPAASKWIEVPTGGSYALENYYWYTKNTGANNDFLTAHSDTQYSVLYLHNAVGESEDLRTWAYGGLLAPAASPSAS